MQLQLCFSHRTLNEGLGNLFSSGPSACLPCRAMSLSYRSLRKSTCRAVLGKPSASMQAHSQSTCRPLDLSILAISNCCCLSCRYVAMHILCPSWQVQSSTHL